MSDVLTHNIKTSLKKGQALDSGFIIIDIVDLDELKSAGIWAKHEKTGVEVFHILNDDSENLFSFTFTTVPQDNTGAAHILEHSVLCGSERYPLKDAFMVLAQGSLQTFLNAITFPDKTVYPASSTNEHDYFNLMSVYGDAVFRPLLSQWTFMQEGHRLEYAEGSSPLSGEKQLSVTGVVYNEMKGAYSSLDAYAGHWSVRAVMPDTPYAFESGGDPAHIPELDWEGLKEFHRSRYAPANCKIFLAGNIPTEKQLSFLNEQFFCKFEGGGAYSGAKCEPVVKAERWEAPKKINIPCPAGSEARSTIFLSWLCTDITDNDSNTALAALAEILLGHDGSPLTRILIESGLGEDITPVSGLEGEIRETVFVAGLKGVEGKIENKSREIEELIMGELRRLVNEGIPAEEIEAALLSMEFSQREIRRAGGPFSLVWMRRSLRGWIHGGKPWDSLLFYPAMANLKKSIAQDKRFFESLIQKYLLDNPHRALVVVEPKEDFLPQQEDKLAKELADADKNMSESERQKIIENSKTLEKIQGEADSPEALAAIPHLSRKDLSAEYEYIPRRFEDLRGTPAVFHDLYTNGITYTDIAFPVDILPPEDYPWLPFFSRAVVSTGLPGMDYGEVSSLLARTVGGFNAVLHTGTAVHGTEQCLDTPAGLLDLTGRDWIIYRMKCLDEKFAQSLDLVLRIITEADFTDQNRIHDLILEMKSQLDSSLAPAGHLYASGRSSRFNIRSRNVDENWNGLTQIDFVHILANTDIALIIKKLKYLQEKIAGAGLVANITGEASGTYRTEFAKRFSRFGAPANRNSSLPFAFPSADIKAAIPPEVYASPSLQIGFAALTLKAALFDTTDQVAEMILTHQLSTGALWEDIRMKGGAYGAFVNSDSLEDCFSFVTYRDPNPVRSLDVISAILKNGAQMELTEDNLVKNIIGCYAKETRPKTSAEKGLVDFFRLLYGIEDGYRQRRLERLINASSADIAAVSASLASRKGSGPVIITGIKSAEQAAKALGVELQMLPV